MDTRKRFIKLLLIGIALAGTIVSVSYTSKKDGTQAVNRLTFERTAARFERGRYIVEGPAHCFQCHSEVDWEKPGAQPKLGKKGAGTIFAEDGMSWLVAPNITPDNETGAGTGRTSSSLELFAKASVTTGDASSR